LTCIPTTTNKTKEMTTREGQVKTTKQGIILRVNSNSRSTLKVVASSSSSTTAEATGLNLAISSSLNMMEAISSRHIVLRAATRVVISSSNIINRKVVTKVVVVTKAVVVTKVVEVKDDPVVVTKVAEVKDDLAVVTKVVEVEEEAVEAALPALVTHRRRCHTPSFPRAQLT